MASLQVRHQRGCALGKAWTPASPVALNGCDCTPTYNVVSRVDGRLVRDKVGTSRDEAETRLARIGFHIDEGTYRAPQHKRVSDAADEFLASLRRRSTTKSEYGTTLAYLKAVAGRKTTDRLSVADVRKLLEHVEQAYLRKHRPKPGEPPREVSPTTLAKHLRHLGTFCEWCIAEGLMRENVAKQLPKSSKPRARKKAPSYFTDAELSRLWPELADRPVYLTLAKLAVTTGLRHGELAGLRWSDVDLLIGEVHVVRQVTHGEVVENPKDAEPRVVHLVPAAREIAEGWYAATGDEGLVFENEAGGYLDDSRSRKTLYAAMDRAGIPRIGEGGGARTFHSLRNTYARITLENGAPLQWVSRELGHSSIQLTASVYGRWSQAGERREAEKLEGAFVV